MIQLNYQRIHSRERKILKRLPQKPKNQNQDLSKDLTMQFEQKRRVLSSTMKMFASAATQSIPPRMWTRMTPFLSVFFCILGVMNYQKSGLLKQRFLLGLLNTFLWMNLTINCRQRENIYLISGKIILNDGL